VRWNKIGKIFDPSIHKLPNECKDFAQSPQAIVFKDFVRVYFSTRAKDPLEGMYLSHVAFVDLTLDLRSLIRVSDHEIIPLGELGAFDEHGIFPFHVVRRGNEIHAYTNGWSRRISVPVETGVGLAISRNNGETFTRQGVGPVISATLHEPYLVGDAFVRVFNDKLHMWYIYGTAWRRQTKDTAPERTYKIGHAVSDNGIDWRKDEGKQIIPDILGLDESQALPTVIELEGGYLMAFCFRQTFDFRSNSKRSYKIGFAWSEDLVNWTRNDSFGHLGTDDWDSEMQCYPHLFRVDEKIYLLYNGNEFGKTGFGGATLVL